MSSRGATITKPGTPDYGWRLNGRPIGTLADRSFDLASTGLDGDFLGPYCLDLETLQACLQCGACTATCDLASEESLFPRRQVTFVRLGLQDQLAADQDIWHCYGCAECSVQCPSGAKPASIMSALRQFATDRYARPRALARIVNSPKLFWVVYAAVAAFLAFLVAVSGNFSPGPGPLVYAGMIPNSTLIPVFSAVSVLPLLLVAGGAQRAWRSWYGESLSRAEGCRFWHALRRAVAEILAHRKLASCTTRRLRPWAHRSVLFAAVGLAAVSGVMALLLAFRRAYPLQMGNPIKLVSNVFAAMLLAGTVYFLVARVVESVHGNRSKFFDWAFLVNLLLVGATGVATEAVRVADLRGWAYPIYFAHLTLVLVLALTLPYSKLAHGVYRVLAVAGREYELIGLTESPCRARPLLQRKASPVFPGAPAAPEGVSRRPAEPSPVTARELLSRGHEELVACTDEEIASAYYELRDEARAEAAGNYYPNLKYLFGSALEREKDRREVRALVGGPDKSEWEAFYEEAVEQPCTWWVENQLVARHALTTCISCGVCTSVCPAAEHYEDYDPRCIVDAALSRDEGRLVELLKSDALWYCAQCGSCNSRCPNENDIMGLVGSLRCLAQLKGYHLESVRGRQQYAGRHLWAANLWNRAMSLYFRNGDPTAHPDFGPRYARWQAELEEQFLRVGAQPDRDGTFGGRKVTPETLEELRSCIRAGGALVLWDKLEQYAEADAARRGLDIDQYYDKVRTEG